MAKNIYEYIGKKELFRRAQNVSYIELPKIKDLVYSKYEGCEWLENEKITIRSQALMIQFFLCISMLQHLQKNMPM